MPNIIALSSIRQSCVDLTYIQTPEINFHHLFNVEKLIRSAYKVNKQAGQAEVLQQLESGGYSRISGPSDSEVFMFFRAWDENLLNDGESFLVSFPEASAYELRNKLFLATPYPMFYAAVSASFQGGAGRVLLVNQAHEPMYPDDMVWQDAEQTNKIPLGELELVKEQFSTDSEYSRARDILLRSGYIVSDSACDVTLLYDVF